jgi:hypothetical protein
VLAAWRVGLANTFACAHKPRADDAAGGRRQNLPNRSGRDELEANGEKLQAE